MNPPNMKVLTDQQVRMMMMLGVANLSAMLADGAVEGERLRIDSGIGTACGLAVRTLTGQLPHERASEIGNLIRDAFIDALSRGDEGLEAATHQIGHLYLHQAQKASDRLGGFEKASAAKH